MVDPEERKKLEELSDMLKKKLSTDRVTALVASMTVAVTRKEQEKARGLAEKAIAAYEEFADTLTELLEMPGEEPFLREEHL